jgi:hypothetical protein
VIRFSSRRVNFRTEIAPDFISTAIYF